MLSAELDSVPRVERKDMTALVWDDNPTYETGVDRGVLYLPTGQGVAWSGLTSIVETPGHEMFNVYFDGKKINVNIYSGDFSAKLSAVTKPREFDELTGLGPIRPGVFLADQVPKLFNFSYRTLMGEFYKLHLLYNLTAIPSDVTHDTVSDQVEPTLFEWGIFAVPEDISGYRSSPQVVIDSREADPAILGDLEDILYGTDLTDPSMPDMGDLVTLLT